MKLILKRIYIPLLYRFLLGWGADIECITDPMARSRGHLEATCYRYLGATPCRFLNAIAPLAVRIKVTVA